MQAFNIKRIFSNVKHERTFNVGKNILFSFILKGISIIISFLLVPLTIDYLNPSEYGIWLTLSSILGWINLFDIGLGNGLRNKLGEALAVGDIELGKKYVSTTFILLIIIVSVFLVVFLIINPFFNWNTILNINPSLGLNLNYLVVIVFTFYCLQFVFKVISYVLLADQKTAMNDLITVAGNIFSLVIIFALTIFTSGSLFYVAVIFSASPFVVLLFSSIFLFKGRYRNLRPAFSFIDFKYTRNLMGLGLQFFIIQIAVCVVIYSSTNIIIVQLFGSENVTIYNIAYKYFNAVSMAYLIILIPFWSASTEAFIKRDFNWIKSAVKKLLLIFTLTLGVTFFMLFFSDTFYSIWVGKDIKVPFILSVVVAIYVTLFNWSNTFINIINGMGRIRLQLYVTVVIALLYIPFAVFMGKNWGLNGIVAASCISLLPTSVLMPIQCVKIYKNKATGIWFK